MAIVASLALFTILLDTVFGQTYPTLNSGIYNSSETPSSLAWYTYNYCNAPHVNPDHYEKPNVSATLVHVELMQRHHKRTPDNLYPNERALNPDAGWDCTDFIQYNYGKNIGKDDAAAVHHETVIPDWHPFKSQIWAGSCDSGQLTAGGLRDAIKHGQDFWGIYSGKLGFLDRVSEKEIYVRTSVSDRTWQVTGGMLYGMDPHVHDKSFKVHTQPNNIDSLVPNYSCNRAGDLRSQDEQNSTWQNHLKENMDLKNRLDSILGTAGLSAWSTWYDHFFDTFTSRQCAGHPLPCNVTSGKCVTQADANQVYAIGDFEYNYIWNDAPLAKNYTKLTFSVMFEELARNFRSISNSTSSLEKARLYIGHDGSMIRLASGLGIKGPLRWPALGSEIVMEVWETGKVSPSQSDHRGPVFALRPPPTVMNAQKSKEGSQGQNYSQPASSSFSGDGNLYVRVLFNGRPAEGLEWVKIENFVGLLESNVVPDVFETCNS